MGLVQAKGAMDTDKCLIHNLYCKYILQSKKTLIVILVCVQLGANAILAVSLAVCKAGAAVNKIPLYKVSMYFHHV